MIPLAEGVQKRHWHASERGKVVGFAVQLEIWFDEDWPPVVR